jgi:hypothetical protein
MYLDVTGDQFNGNIDVPIPRIYLFPAKSDCRYWDEKPMSEIEVKAERESELRALGETPLQSCDSPRAF